MRNDSFANRKEVLILPARSDVVAEIEKRFEDEGLRFRCLRDHEELVRQEANTRPFLLILDLFQLPGLDSQMRTRIEDCLGRCKTVIFGRERDLDAWAMGLLNDVVLFEHPPRVSALSAALETILRDGWGCFKTEALLKSPYYLLFCHGTKAMRTVKTLIDQVASTEVTTLIQGERGTGKDVVAQAIHLRSSRRNKPLIKVNCAGLSGEMLAGEIFGFESDLLRGGDARKPGKFELANNGTILLDEIGELDRSIQERLLRVLQGGAFCRLGGRESIPINTRIIASTNSDLWNAVEAGRFREALYYRLNAFRIMLPPLRERREEIPSLIRFFLDLYNSRYGRSYPGISEETEGIFLIYDWPGNIRQLQTAIERIVAVSDETPVVQEMLEKQGSSSESTRPILPSPKQPKPLRGNLKDIGRRAAREAEKAVIGKMLKQTRWNRRKAAELLQISYKAMLYKIREYRLDQ